MNLNEKLAQRRKEREQEAAAVQADIFIENSVKSNFESSLVDKNQADPILTSLKETEYKNNGLIGSRFRKAEEVAEFNKRLEEMAI